MSDITQAPPPAAPQSEVPINPNPVNIPTPIGQQAPDKPVDDIQGSKHRPESRREAIQKAFAKAEQPEPAKPKAKPAEAKPAENNREVPRDTERYREQGRFARAPGPEPSNAQKAQNAPDGSSSVTSVTKHPPLAENAPYREPPQRMAEHAKAEWAAVPESVRGEIGRMHQEFGQAYNQYRGDHETMNSIRHFHEMATQHGTTLDRALANYVGMEQKLRSDLVGGLDQIVNNLGIQTPDGQRITLRDVAYHILNQSPEQHQLTQSRNTQSAMSLQLGQISQRLDAMDQKQQQFQQEQVYRYTRAQIDQFADDGKHDRFDELADLIENEVKLGFDIESAYRRAELLRPASQAAQTRDSAQAAQTRNPSAQTRSAARSISGSPDGDVTDARNGVSKKANGKVSSRRDAIQNAIRRVNGSF